MTNNIGKSGPLLWLCAAALLASISGCGGGKPADPSDQIKARFDKFHAHLIKGEIDPALAFLKPAFVEKRTKEGCQQALKTMSDAYKKSGVKEGELQFKSADLKESFKAAMVHSVRQAGKTMNAAPTEKWELIGHEWYYSP